MIFSMHRVDIVSFVSRVLLFVDEADAFLRKRSKVSVFSLQKNLVITTAFDP